MLRTLILLLSISAVAYAESLPPSSEPATGSFSFNATLILGTASRGGTYFQRGENMADVWNGTLKWNGKLRGRKDIQVHTKATKGAVDNLELVEKDEIQIGIATGYTLNEHLTIYKNSRIRVVVPLWPSVVHFIIRSNYMKAGDTLNSIASRTPHFSLCNGILGSGGERQVSRVMANLEFTGKFHSCGIENNMMAANKLLNKEIEHGFPFVVGIQAPVITYLLSNGGGDFSLLSLTAGDFATIQQKNSTIYGSVWNAFTIPADTYPGQTADIRSLMEYNYLIVRSTLHPRIVSWLTRQFYENLETLKKETAGPDIPDLQNVSDKMPALFQEKIHRGALNYYQENDVFRP